MSRFCSLSEVLDAVTNRRIRPPYKGDQDDSQRRRLPHHGGRRRPPPGPQLWPGGLDGAPPVEVAPFERERVDTRERTSGSTPQIAAVGGAVFAECPASRPPAKERIDPENGGLFSTTKLRFDRSRHTAST